MTKEQFIEALINEGYKLLKHTQANYDGFKQRNRSVTIQELCGIHIYYVIERKNENVNYSQFNVTDYAKALKNIKSFERKLKR